jgi:hypothetical protein
VSPQTTTTVRAFRSVETQTEGPVFGNDNKHDREIFTGEEPSPRFPT